MNLDAESVRQKVKVLVKSMGISKTKLGEILGGYKKDEDPRVRINRTNRFFSGAQKNISLQQVNDLAAFFERPIEWFLSDGEKAKGLSHSEKTLEILPKPLGEIRKNLQKMGFDQSYIDTLILQLKAMEAYNMNRES